MLLLGQSTVRATIIKSGLPWKPGSGDPPAIVTPEGWHFLTPQEAATVEAFVDRLIPPDPETPGGKDLGCAVFIDRQLAGPYGRYESYYMEGPFQNGTEQQGPQSPVTPAQHYRAALAALDAACRSKFGGKTFVELADDQKDEVIKGLEGDSLKLEGTDGKEFFKLILKDTQNGAFADPIYGGNRDMAAWKIERGRYLAIAGDCASCHTLPGSGHDYAGGRPIETPFGTLIAPNITPDPQTGIGAWTDDEFVNSLTSNHEGRRPNLRR